MNTVPKTCQPEAIKPVQFRWPIRLYMRFKAINPLEALNCENVESNTPESTLDVATQLKLVINQLKGEGIDPETGRVNYRLLRTSETFQEYVNITHRLRDFNPWRLNDLDERKAFWINLYNALIIHAVIAYGTENSINEIAGVFDRAAYIIGGYRLSASDIEHGILRANAGHPAFPGPQFTQDDPRQAFKLPRLDPRVHFALVCAAQSCPPIGIYDAEQIHRQLDLATWNFINQGGVIVKANKRIVYLSRIFSWYATDFGGKFFGYMQQAQILRFIAPYLDAPDEAELLKQHAETFKVKFLKYDWSLNV